MTCSHCWHQLVCCEPRTLCRGRTVRWQRLAKQYPQARQHPQSALSSLQVVRREGVHIQALESLPIECQDCLLCWLLIPGRIALSIEPAKGDCQLSAMSLQGRAAHLK